MRRIVMVCLLALAAVACSDDKDDEVDPGIRELCVAQCDRADECGFSEGITPAQCQAGCQDIQAQQNSGSCKFTEAELHVCADAFSAQECSAFGSQQVPADCMKTCTR